MTNLFELAGRLRRLSLFCVVAALCACGPGTGGTGTGPISFSGGSLSGASIAGAVCQVGCDLVTLQLDEQRVELAAACRRFVYFGTWAVSANGELVLGGSIETTVSAGTASAPGSLRVQFSDKDTGSKEVTVTLTDAAGAILSGPSVLSRLASLTAAPSVCARP